MFDKSFYIEKLASLRKYHTISPRQNSSIFMDKPEPKKILCNWKKNNIPKCLKPTLHMMYPYICGPVVCVKPFHANR